MVEEQELESAGTAATTRAAIRSLSVLQRLWFFIKKTNGAVFNRVGMECGTIRSGSPRFLLPVCVGSGN